MSVFTTDTSADTPVRPPLPVLSVLVEVRVAGAVSETVGVLWNIHEEMIVAVTEIVVFAPDARLGIGDGNAAQPPPFTFVIVRFVGVSGTCTLVAVDRQALARNSE